MAILCATTHRRGHSVHPPLTTGFERQRDHHGAPARLPGGDFKGILPRTAIDDPQRPAEPGHVRPVNVRDDLDALAPDPILDNFIHKVHHFTLLLCKVTPKGGNRRALLVARPVPG